MHAVHVRGISKRHGTDFRRNPKDRPGEQHKIPTSQKEANLISLTIIEFPGPPIQSSGPLLCSFWRRFFSWTPFLSPYVATKAAPQNVMYLSSFCHFFLLHNS